jgi:hypothetical protein
VPHATQDAIEIRWIQENPGLGPSLHGFDDPVAMERALRQNGEDEEVAGCERKVLLVVHGRLLSPKPKALEYLSPDRYLDGR